MRAAAQWGVCLLLAAGASGASVPTPWPTGRNLSSAWTSVSDLPGAAPPGTLLLAASLQGVLGREVATGQGTDTLYLSGRWDRAAAAAATFPAVASLVNATWNDTLRRFHRRAGGYVLVNLSSADSVSAAVTYAAGASKAPLIADEASVALLADLGLHQIFDAREADFLQVLSLASTHGLSWSTKQSVVQEMSKAWVLADYCIAQRAVMLATPTPSDDTTNMLVDKAMDHLRPPFAVLGWWDEYGIVSRASKRGGMVLASDWAHSLAATSTLSLPALQQKRPEQQAAAASSPQAAKHRVAFLMSDGDNVQWMINAFDQDKWYGSKRRGSLPVGWTLPPSLLDLAPMVAKTYYDAQTEQDTFVAGVSGAGTAYPDLMTAEQSADFGELTAAMLRRADMRVLNIMSGDDRIGQSGWYNATTHEAIAAAAPDLRGILWWPYQGYANLAGSIHFSRSGLPVIGGRWAFWAPGNDNLREVGSAEDLAAKLNAGVRDASSADGYSVIPVHVWSKSVDDIARVVDLLHPDVEVVGVEELVELVRANVRPREVLVV